MIRDAGVKYWTLSILFVLFLVSTCPASDSPYSSGIDIGFQKAECTEDTIPDIIEAGRSYPITVTFMNRGMVSWRYDVERFGLYYEGLQSSINVDPVFSPLNPDVEIRPQEKIIFPITLLPSQKPGDYTLSFSMATKKGSVYTPFPDSFTKTVTVIPEGGISSPEFGSIIVESYPSGAKVRMGDLERGETPLTMPDLNPAKYELIISHPDYTSKWATVTVKRGTANRISVDFTSDNKPTIVSENVQRFTLLGAILDNIPLVVFCIVILFFGFQILMMGTGVIPEKHPIRRVAGPILFVHKGSDGRIRFGRNSTGSGPSGGSGGTAINESADGSNKNSKNTSPGGGSKKQQLNDTNVRGGSGENEKSSKSEAEEKKKLSVKDEDQDQKDINNPFGFPSALTDRYEPLGIAGDDHYARIFKVLKKDNGAIRSLKVAHMQGADSEILKKEASVWAHLRHPNVVHLYKAEFNEDLTFLENEYLDGFKYKGEDKTSIALLPKPVKEKYAVSLIKDIAEGVKYTHNQGIRHYHLQAGDVLLTKHLNAKLSGYARGKNELGFSIPESDVKDAPALYIAPEQRNMEKYGNTGKRTDIFQVGVIFYELLTGFLPYSKEAYQAVRKEAFVGNETELIPLSSFKKTLEKYDPIIAKLLSIKKEGRYSQIEDFLKDLKDIEDTQTDINKNQ